MYKRQHKAQRGEHGMGSNCSGLDGRSIYLQVPVGTSLYDQTTGELIHDFESPDEQLIIAKGGRCLLYTSANQYWYRTQAIASYIRGLIKLDPSSLIILVSDHVPPLDEGVKSYQDFHYLDNIDDSIHLNRIVVVEDGKVVRHKTIHHYNIPSLIYDYLTSLGYCAQNKCDLSSAERENQYRLLISRAVSPM